MSGECCRVYTLTVEIQENGIIRDPFGFIIGHCDDKWLRRMTNQPPYGLTVSEDGKLVNWCGTNYVKQREEEESGQ